MSSSDVLTGLFSAAYDGNIALVKSVLKNNGLSADISDPIKGSTALQWACCGGSLEMVEWLVREGGAKVDHRNKDDRTALFFACEHCHKPVAAFLIGQNGVDVNAKDGPSGHSPLHRACIAGQTREKTGAAELIAWLLTVAGADPQAMDRSGRKPGEADLAKEAPCLNPTARAAEISQTLKNARMGVAPGSSATPAAAVAQVPVPTAVSPRRPKAVAASKTGEKSPKPKSPKMRAVPGAGTTAVATAIPAAATASRAADVPVPAPVPAPAPVAAPSSLSPRRSKAVVSPKAAPAEAPPSPTERSLRPATTVASARAAAVAKAVSPPSPRPASPQRQRTSPQRQRTSPQRQRTSPQRQRASPSRVAARAAALSGSTSDSPSKATSAGTRSMAAVPAVEAPSGSAPVSSVNRATSPPYSTADSPTGQAAPTPTKSDVGEASPSSASGVSSWAAKPRSGGVAPRGGGGIAPRGGGVIAPPRGGSALRATATSPVRAASAASTENKKPTSSLYSRATTAPTPPAAVVPRATTSSSSAAAAAAPPGFSPSGAPAARFQRQVSGPTAPVAGLNVATGNAAAVIGGSNRPKASDLAAAFENKARSGRGADAPAPRRGNSGLSAAGLAARAPALSLVSSGSTTSSPGGSTSGSSVGRPTRTLSSTPEKRSTPPTAASSASRATPAEILGRGSVMQRKQVYVAAAQKGSHGSTISKDGPGPFLGKAKKNKEGSFMDKFVSMFSISPQSSPASSPSRSASRSPRARQRSPATGNVNTKAQQESARMGFFNTNKSFKVADSTEKE